MALARPFKTFQNLSNSVDGLAGVRMLTGKSSLVVAELALALMLAVSLVYGYRVGVEERALLATTGDSYRRYMSRTKRFVPFLF